MPTLTVDSVTPKDGNRPWKIHANGSEYVTWDDGDGELLKMLQGTVVEFEFEKRTKTRDGKTYTDNVITSVVAPGEAPPSHRPDEPNINTAKQVVIIRQNAWGQTNHLYETALAFLKAGGSLVEGEELTVTPQALEKVVTALMPGMMKTSATIEHNIRRWWFPPDEVEEVPF